MARQVTAQIRLQVTGGQATPAPPVGPALGQHGVNIGQFVSQFNDRTKDMRGITVPVVDEIATIALNLWAEEHGYTKIQTNLLGI